MADTLRLDMDGTDRLSPKLEKVEKHLKAIDGASEKAGRMLSGLMGLFGAGAIAGAGAGLAKGILDATNAMEGYRARLTTVLGTQKRVNETLEFLSKFARDTPYDLNEVTDAFVRMSAYGLQPTAERFKDIGDFAASMNRTFSDAVEAIADANHGEFERLREFGITKEMVAAQDKNLINAKGQITNYARFQTTLFKMMEMRSKGSMERLMNTPQGKLTNLQDSIGRAFLKIGDSIKGPFMNAIEILTRLVDRLVSSGNLEKIGKWAERMFSVENMKAFAKLALGTFLTIKDFLTGDVKDWFIVLQTSWQRFYLSIKMDLEDIAGRFTRFITMFQAAMSAPLAKRWGMMGEAIGSLKKPGGNLIDQLLNINEMAVLNKQQGAALGRIDARSKVRAGAGSFIDQLFAGIGNNKGPGDTNPANFGSGVGVGAGGKSALDRITEMILGGGQLARLGIKPSELGGGFKFLDKAKPIEVNVNAGSRSANDYFKSLFEQFLAEAVRQGKVAVPGGH